MDLLLLFHLICGRGRDLDLHLCLQEEVIRGGQLVATERAGSVAMEPPLKDAVPVEDVGAGHGAELCHHLYISSCCWLPPCPDLQDQPKP